MLLTSMRQMRLAFRQSVVLAHKVAQVKRHGARLFATNVHDMSMPSVGADTMSIETPALLVDMDGTCLVIVVREPSVQNELMPPVQPLNATALPCVRTCPSIQTWPSGLTRR
jgi:hypothetical protein